jgi:hypothetical protein
MLLWPQCRGLDEIRLDLVPRRASTTQHRHMQSLRRTSTSHSIMAYSSPRHSQNFYQYDASTPPPPPPKPGRSSGNATPSQGPPLPPPPPGQSSYSGDQQQSPHAQQQYLQIGSEQPTIQPPDDGWLPDVLKDKPYAYSALLISAPLRYK